MRDYAKHLGAIRLSDSEGRCANIGSAWLDQPALLVFIRHFG